MKKIIAMLLVLSLAAFMLVACGEDKKSETGKEESKVESKVETTEDATTEDATTEDATTEDATTEDASADDVKVMTYAEYDAAAIDDAVVIEAYVQDKQSWWEKDGQGLITLYAQDEDGAYFIYQMACSQEDAAKLTTGTKIRVSGFKAEWSGEIEIVDATFEIVEGNYVAEAMDVTSILASEDLIKHQNKLVSFKGMTVEASKDADGNDVAFLYNYDGSGLQGSDLYFNASVDGKTYTFTVESYLRGSDTEVYKAVEALKVGDKIDMTGFLYWYNGANPHIITVAAAQ